MKCSAAGEAWRGRLRIINKPLATVLVVVSLFSFLTLCPMPVYGHGFANFAQGARATGMGGAFTAIADDPTANYYNAAGIAFMEGTQVMLGSTVFAGKTAIFQSTGNSDMPGVTQGSSYNLDRESHVLPFVHLTHSLPNGLGFGVSGYSMWGQRNSWPEEWEGRFAPGGLESEIKSYRVQAVTAFAPNDWFSFSGGIFQQWIDLSMRQKLWVPMLMQEFDYSGSGSDAGIGWTAGILLRPFEWLSFGTSYRSRVRHNLESMEININPQIPSLGIQGGRGQMDFTTPGVVFLGTAVKWEKWTVAFDIYWTEWSVQDKIDIQFRQPFLGQTRNVQSKEWKDSYTYGVGLEYSVTDHLRLRGGYIHDETPVPSETLDPMVFSGDSRLVCLGIGYEMNRFQGDLSFSRVFSKDRRFDNVLGDPPHPGSGRVIGEFKESSTNIFVLSLSYLF